MTTDREYPATIARALEYEMVIKKSRFITHLSPVTSIDEAESIIAAIKKKAWDATHNCSAMVTGLLADQARSSDDGEPSGTAGIPMLEVLRRRTLTDIVAVVTRYYGGVKLGAGGLVRAYSSAVSEALDTASFVERRMLRQFTVAVPHADAGRIENLVRDWVESHEASLSDTEYGAQAVLSVWIPPSQASGFHDLIAAASAGSLMALSGDERIIDIPAAL
ncbi:YigZ family protein [Microbacterium sp. YY-01]|uniref:YigZ family protein n=1 Tax=Microbacterium sp. YY-01 TaxID=3421634 RepID=UPI003D16848F